VLPEKLIGPQLLKQFSPFYGRGSAHVPGLVKCFVTWQSSHSDELLTPCPTPSFEDHPLSAIRHCIFSIFAATIHIWRPFLLLQP